MSTLEINKKIKKKMALNEAFSSNENQAPQISQQAPVSTQPSEQTFDEMKTSHRTLSSPERYPRKVTFYTTEETYFRFQQLYHKLMLAGRGAQKAELFTEALEMLLAKEGNNGLI